jgi:hypothetical protein
VFKLASIFCPFHSNNNKKIFLFNLESVAFLLFQAPSITVSERVQCKKLSLSYIVMILLVLRTSNRPTLAMGFSTLNSFCYKVCWPITQYVVRRNYEILDSLATENCTIVLKNCVVLDITLSISFSVSQCFKTSVRNISGLQNLRFSKRTVYKRPVSKRLVSKRSY